MHDISAHVEREVVKIEEMLWAIVNAAQNHLDGTASKADLRRMLNASFAYERGIITLDQFCEASVPRKEI